MGSRPSGLYPRDLMPTLESIRADGNQNPDRDNDPQQKSAYDHQANNQCAPHALAECRRRPRGLTQVLVHRLSIVVALEPSTHDRGTAYYCDVQSIASPTIE